MKEFIIAFTITFLLCSGILFSIGIISVRVSILIAYVVLLLSLILGLIVISRLFILQWKLQGENKMTEKELEQQSEEFKKGFSVGYEYGKQNERKLQLGKTNLLRDIERLEKENEQLKKEEKAWFDLVTRVGELKKENEQLKKNAIIWHKQDDVDDIYDTINDWSVHTYICRMKDGSFNIATGIADEGCNGDVGRNIYFEINDEKYYSDDIEAWAELPRVEK